ncbi:vanadium-dependent haloperoxidase [Chitinophaga japonensis]|uniref:PAP2 superfamily protein n=1 Tax=Chitinophaga japonensis TaxID=104662 RepID=A0A562TD52_CHIJA|nr:vanadium-dependent haloperoxidase [Chitinophaga japonensis]TWI91449.1 PAP2 superfamily protein [Chitinophaga japonensis]
MLKYCLYLLPLLLITAGCRQQRPVNNEVLHSPLLYSQTVKQLTDVVVHDIFSPPVASRIYVYSTIAGYEVIAHSGKGYRSLAGQLHGLDATPAPADSAAIDFPFAALIALSTTGKALIFSEDKLQLVIDSLQLLAREAGLPAHKREASIAYGQQMAKVILDWCKEDNYAQTRSGVKYTVTEEEGRWTPTPPAYMSAIEPQWNQIRTMVIDSANEFMVPPPPAFNMKDSASDFYKMTREIYDMGMTLTDEQKAIADFWDCNPYKLNLSGHVSFATKKITPGGHWINICGIAARQAKADFNKTVCTYAKVAIALMDAFIVCWDEKFRSNLIRPETVINKYWDESWKPYLQTPPFPEYTSGHSVVSTASATVLTQLYGPSLAFRDSSELDFGLPSRDFPSFLAASREAAESRLYGGIHFRPAVEEGIVQGRQVGEMVVKRLKMEP